MCYIWRLSSYLAVNTFCVINTIQPACYRAESNFYMFNQAVREMTAGLLKY